jgi:FkbM family methyltransferase
MHLLFNRQSLKLGIKIFFRKKRAKIIQYLPLKKDYKSRYAFNNYFTLMHLESQFKKTIFHCLFGNYVQGIVYNTANGMFMSSPADMVINHKLGYNGQYEIDKIYHLMSLVNEKSVIYVLGAHLGTLLVPLSKKVKKIYGFEANPDTFFYLKNNLSLNKIDNAEIFNCGVYNEQGHFPFYQNEVNTGGSKIKPVNDDFVYNYDNPILMMVETVCLDDFQIKHNIPFPDMMIVDIEGSEYAALSKAQNSLNHCKYLYIEFVPHHLTNVANITVETFLSIITPYFDRMKITGSERIFKGENICEVLNVYYMNNISADLLFF